jgi:hypothetical protein
MIDTADRCVCDSRYGGCRHANPCRQPNDGTGRGPWCADCQPRRLAAAVRASLLALREDFR